MSIAVGPIYLTHPLNNLCRPYCLLLLLIIVICTFAILCPLFLSQYDVKKTIKNLLNFNLNRVGNVINLLKLIDVSVM